MYCFDRLAWKTDVFSSVNFNKSVYSTAVMSKSSQYQPDSFSVYRSAPKSLIGDSIARPPYQLSELQSVDWR